MRRTAWGASGWSVGQSRCDVDHFLVLENTELYATLLQRTVSPRLGTTILTSPGFADRNVRRDVRPLPLLGARPLTRHTSEPEDGHVSVGECCGAVDSNESLPRSCNASKHLTVPHG